MITEDYVSFEIAKLLKKKGFEGYSIITTYDADAANAYIKELQEKHLPYSSDDPKLKEFYYTMPTLQMAMKWLREIHNLHITILWDCGAYIGKNSFYYHIDRINNYEDKGYNKIGFDSNEEACEAAIKYCLENLI